RLSHDGWFSKDAGGYRVTELVQGFVKYLRDENRRASKSAAASRVQDARARLLELRVAEREGKLMETSDALDATDQLVGAFLTGIGELPARCFPRDIPHRQIVEREVYELRRRIADKAKQKVAELSHEG